MPMFNAVLPGVTGKPWRGEERGRRGDHAKPGDHLFILWGAVKVAFGSDSDPPWGVVTAWWAFPEGGGVRTKATPRGGV